MAILKGTVVEIVAGSNGKPTVREWSPSAYEQPGLTTTHKLLGVAMTDAAYEEPVAAMKRGYLRSYDAGAENGWSVGDLIWAGDGGVLQNTRAAAPLPQVLVGTVFADEGGDLFTIDVDLRVMPSLGELSGVSVETPADLDVFIYDSATHTWEPRQLDHGGDLAGLADDDHPQYKKRHGFVRSSAGAHLVTISYNATNRTVTVTPTGATFDFYVNGVLVTKTGAQTTAAHTATNGGWFLTYDASGTFAWSQTAWDIADLTKIPVAYVYYYSGAGVCFFEAHEANRNLGLHKNLHFTQGTRRISGFALSGYTLNTDSDAGVTFAVASGVIADEDIFHSVSALADAGPYTIFYRTGASGDWTWTSTDVVPFKHGTYPQYNQLTGGSWTLTDLTGTGLGQWVNYYLCAVPSVVAATQLILIPGQTAHASLAAADGESLSSLNLGAAFPFQEVAPLARITFNAQTAFGGTYKAKLVKVTEILAGGASVTVGSSPSIHNSLSGREATDAHPASSITFTPYVGTNLDLAATDVQSAIEEIADEVGAASGAVEDLTTTEMNGSKVLTPDGLGGVQWSNVAPTSLDDIGDVNAPAPNNGDVLAWDDTPGEWVPVSPSAPGVHASSHENGGLDEISVAGLSGVLADPQNPVDHATEHENGGGDEILVENMATAETGTSKVLKPNGTGGVTWGTGGGGGGTVHGQHRFMQFSPALGDSVIPLFEASASITVKAVRCIHSGSGSVSVNAKKNYRGSSSDILASDLTSSASAWSNSAATGGGVSLSSGDEIDVELVGVTGYVEYVVVIVDFEEAL